MVDSEGRVELDMERPKLQQIIKGPGCHLKEKYDVSHNRLHYQVQIVHLTAQVRGCHLVLFLMSN